MEETPTFEDFKKGKVEETPLFSEFIQEKQNDMAELQIFMEWNMAKLAEREYGMNAGLNEAEVAEVNKYVKLFNEEYGGDLSQLDRAISEGFFGKVLGGITGFILGPTIGKIIANSLGIERGVLYDMFTSRLVSTALGAAIAKAASQHK